MGTTCRMPPKRAPAKGLPDSISANPEAKKLLVHLIARGVIPRDAKPSDWYYRQPHARTFESVSIDKFRPYFKRLLTQKYSAIPTSASTFLHEQQYQFLLTICRYIAQKYNR